MAETKRYDQLEAGDVLAGGATVIQAGQMGPAQADTFSRRNPQIEIEVDHPVAGKQVFRGAPDAEVQMEATAKEVT
jgi:hypothetical protein